MAIRLMKKEDANKASLQLNDVIEEAAALLHRQLLGKGVVLRCDLRDLPPIVADRTQLQQMVINLMINAAEAMEDVQGRARILVIRSLSSETGRVVVTIEDSGAGIPSDSERLFDAFFTTKASRLGMGLSICRSIVEDHDGRLWAISNSGRPVATFQFELPSSVGVPPRAIREP